MRWFRGSFAAAVAAFGLVSACVRPLEGPPGTPEKSLPQTASAARVAIESPEPDLGPAWRRCAATWYGQAYAGRETASGETFEPDELTVATLDRGIPFQAILEVRSGRRQVLVRVTDRMRPARKKTRAPIGRCLDLSRAAFERLAPAAIGILDVEWRRAS